jgi:hypothetical protein
MVKKLKFKLVEAGDGGREEHFEGRWSSEHNVLLL